MPTKEYTYLISTNSFFPYSSLPTYDRIEPMIADILRPYERRGILFHAMRSRVAGTRRFVSFHVLVPGEWSVKRGHDLCEEVELAICKALPSTHINTHLEPLNDPASWEDQELGRQCD